MPRFTFFSFSKNKSKANAEASSSADSAAEEISTPVTSISESSLSQPARRSESFNFNTGSNRHRSNIVSAGTTINSVSSDGRTSAIDIPSLPPGSPSIYRYNFDYITKGVCALDDNGGRGRARSLSSSGSNRMRSNEASASSASHVRRRASSVCATRRTSLAAPPPAALRKDVGHHSANGVMGNGWHGSYQDQKMFGSQYGMALPGNKAAIRMTSAESMHSYDRRIRRRAQSLTFHQCYSSPSLVQLPGLSSTSGHSETDLDPERESLSSVSSSSSYSSGNSEYDSPPSSSTTLPVCSPLDTANPLDEIESSKLFQEFSSPARRAALEHEFEEERRRREAEYARILRWRYVAGILLSRSSGKPISRKFGAPFPNAPPGLGLELNSADEVHAMRMTKRYVKSSLSSVVVLEVH